MAVAIRPKQRNHANKSIFSRLSIMALYCTTVFDQGYQRMSGSSPR